MSGDLERQLREDKVMRDQALSLLKTDLEHLKGDYAQRSIKERATDKIKTSATSIYGEAVETASEHKGPLIALVAALVLWFARHPLLSIFTGRRDDDDQDDLADDNGGRWFATERAD